MKLLVLLLAQGLAAQTYTAASVVNSATGRPGLSPNAFGTIYGKDLALSERALFASDMQGSVLPLTLPGTGVRVFVEGIAAPVWYVSPTQINFLTPPNLLPKRDAKIVVTVFGRTGPSVNVDLNAASPGLFQADPETPIAIRLDGTFATRQAPLPPGTVVILYACGLGRTVPDAQYREAPKDAAWLEQRSLFQVLLDGVAVPRESILYVGATPGFAGLYQINFRIPADSGPFPEIRLSAAGMLSPSGLRLPVQ